jgi:hypothetical protein
MYSALIRRSLIVALIPRLSITGSFERPTSLSSEKFCMLRAPTWRQSAYFSMTSRCFVSMISVITGNPRRCARLGEQAETFFAESLKGVWRSPRFEGATTQNFRTRGFDGFRNADKLVTIFDRTWATHEHHFAAADRDITNPDFASVAATEFTRDELVRFQALVSRFRTPESQRSAARESGLSGPITPITVRIAPRLTSALRPHSLIRSRMC